ncbi:MAG: LacI family DNA-binding transcriptional regulator [Amnibacterium sp.]
MPTQPVPERGRPRLHDVARRAGVSAGTVSNVLNHPHRVSPAMRARVLAVIGELGFTRNAMASALARGDSGTVGLVVVDLSNSLFVDIARGAQRSAREHDRYLQLATAENDFALLEEHMAVMNGAHVSGLIVAPMQDASAAIERSRRVGCPVVVLNYDTPDHFCCQVLIDNERVGYLAGRHLVETGRRRIAFVGGVEVQPVIRRRLGVRRAVAELGGGVVLEEFEASNLEPSSGAAVARMLAERPPETRPDAVIGVSDLLAMSLISEFRSLGLRVPGDVAVMGCDHNSAAWGGAVPLTSVTMEGAAMGAEGMRLLLRELAEPAEQHVHSTVLLQPRLLARESTIGR